MTITNVSVRENLPRAFWAKLIARLWLLGPLVFAITATSGCAFHYYDQKTNTEHLWGFGHMKTRISPMEEGVCIQASEVQTVGLALNAGQENYGLSAGFNHQGRMIVSSNTAARVEWYHGDFFHARAGTNFPFKISAENPIEPRNPK